MYKRNYIILIIISVISIFCIEITNYTLNINKLVYEYYIENLSQDLLNEAIEKKNNWEWLFHLIIPLIILLRSGLVALCLNIGLFFYDTENKIKFKQLFRAALLGEFVLVLVGFVKLLYFLFIKTDYTLQDIQQFYPLSYINFLDIENLEPWLIYPLQTINLFEITYFFVLVYGVHKLLKNNYWKSFEITAASYGTGLVIWLGLVMFLTLNLT